MSEDRALHQQIEALRRQLHEAVGPGYDPERIQAARALSAELDRLVVEVLRSQMAHMQDQPRPRRRR